MSYGKEHKTKLGNLEITIMWGLPTFSQVYVQWTLGETENKAPWMETLKSGTGLGQL